MYHRPRTSVSRSLASWAGESRLPAAGSLDADAELAFLRGLCPSPFGADELPPLPATCPGGRAGFALASRACWMAAWASRLAGSIARAAWNSSRAGPYCWWFMYHRPRTSVSRSLASRAGGSRLPAAASGDAAPGFSGWRGTRGVCPSSEGLSTGVDPTEGPWAGTDGSAGAAGAGCGGDWTGSTRAGDWAPTGVSVRSGGRRGGAGSRNISQEPPETAKTKTPKRRPKGSGQLRSSNADPVSNARFSREGFLSIAVAFARAACVIVRPARHGAGRHAFEPRGITRRLHRGFREYTPDHLPLVHPGERRRWRKCRLGSVRCAGSGGRSAADLNKRSRLPGFSRSRRALLDAKVDGAFTARERHLDRPRTGHAIVSDEGAVGGEVAGVYNCRLRVADQHVC